MASKQLSLKHLSMPILLEMFLRYFSLIINTVMVSQYSNFLVGAMGAGNQVADLFIIIFSFLSVGCSVVIAQALGAKDYTLARKAIHQSLFLNALLGFVCGSLILWHGEFLLYLLQIPNELLKNSEIYLHMLGICLFFDAMGIVLAAIIRVYNMAYWVMFTTLLMNVVIFIGNFYVLHFTKLELFGVGLSNILGRLVAFGMLVVILSFKLKIHLKIKEMISLEKAVLKKIFNIGGFAAGEHLIWFIQYTIAFAFVASLSKENLSVQTIYFQISLLIMLVGQAISVANEIIIGKLVGAKYLNVAYKHTWIALYFSVVASAFVALLNYVLQDFTMDVVKLEESLKELMIPLFTLSIFLEISRTFNIVMVNSLRASGDARFPFLSGVVFMLGVSLPVGYVLCFYAGLGILGVWIGFCADEFLRGIVNSYRWKSKKWQGKALV
ncbi:MATE family efflux transporter [Campylobacter sp. IFREMER_LSEM_CL1846]|uniref:MATE family efflux transporter n=1 Tax=Campylobacter sp. IFREMER_LSEM_CL1846 TaxID=2911614 RepID=UPI0021E6903A|nr:MATE family efflux transporter [Campylobacter sp. IFREMER_LSEM_CL1846]HEC1748881.1 MATE family efflux transporter [Campylobacter lari]MCV3434093.1 MATE family efflux transporter [Campylobacter sp. IFREMER_LSEM_CL1846]HEC1769375.1 MATE family efflux transporter [Campylobacter lari]HEC1790095.1 MATE family efflux transporter [Campylobacter lari]HEC1795786.1 MATE family efflux transporter [Campylobacter lari]